MDIKDRQFKSYIFTGIKEACSGCGACTQICAKSALTMKADEEGFLYPVMDSEKCVKCGLCDSRCPEVTDQCNVKGEQHCYIATTDDKTYFMESASIGICTMLSDYIIDQGGVVFGCFLDENDWTAYHIAVYDKSGVQSIRNSKYLQSDTKETFSEVKRVLQTGKIVLYIGTPCQIAGLKAFLHKDYENLYTIDIICHGVFSPKLMSLEAEYWEKKFNSKIKNFRFRSKRVFKRTNGGMVNFDILANGKVKHVERYAGSSPSYHCFAYSGDGMNYNLRLSCYSCPFKSTSRYGDFTIGDPWLIKKQIVNDSKLGHTNVVRSIFSTNTNKAKDLLKYIEKYIYRREYSFNDIFVQPAVKSSKRKIPLLRYQIYQNLNTVEYGKYIETIFNCDLEKEHRNFVRKYNIDTIKHIVKSLIGYYKWKK